MRRATREDSPCDRQAFPREIEGVTAKCLLRAEREEQDRKIGVSFRHRERSGSRGRASDRGDRGRCPAVSFQIAANRLPSGPSLPSRAAELPSSASRSKACSYPSIEIASARVASGSGKSCLSPPVLLGIDRFADCPGSPRPREMPGHARAPEGSPVHRRRPAGSAAQSPDERLPPPWTHPPLRWAPRSLPQRGRRRDR